MSNMHRILWFDQQVRSMNYPNSRKLAQQFEISTRQANRDIEYLMNSLGAPLCYSAKSRGYEYEDTAYILPSLYITEEEKKVISFLAYRYEQHQYGDFDDGVKNSKLQKQVSRLFRRLSNIDSTEHSIPSFAIESAIVDTAYTLRLSLAQSRKVAIVYNHAEHGEIRGTIHPYQMYFKHYADYISAYCEETRQTEIYRLDRMVSTRMLQERFEKMHHDALNEHIHASQVRPFVAVLECSGQLNGEEWGSYNVKPLGNGQYAIEFIHIDPFIDQLLSVRGWTAIHKPKWLKEKVKRRLMQLLTDLETQ